MLPVLLIAYLFYGYGRLIVERTNQIKNDSKLIEALKTDRGLRTIFTTTAGLLVSFFFALLYAAKAFMSGSVLCGFLCEFYLTAAILKLYLTTIVKTGIAKSGQNSCLIVYAVGILMSFALAGIAVYVIYFDAIFEKSVFLVGAITMFTTYKFVSAAISYHQGRIAKLDVELAEAYVALSSAMLSVYTLCVALLVMISQNPEMKRFSLVGFASAISILVLGIAGIRSVAIRIKGTVVP